MIWKQNQEMLYEVQSSSSFHTNWNSAMKVYIHLLSYLVQTSNDQDCFFFIQLNLHKTKIIYTPRLIKSQQSNQCTSEGDHQVTPWFVYIKANKHD